MKIVINGENKEIGDSVTVGDLLKMEKVQTPEYVSVQVNGGFVQREAFATSRLKDGDQVDFLYFMGGGSKKGGTKSDFIIRTD